MKKLTKAQLAKLTREQKLEYLAVIEEKKRRAALKKDLYVPNEGQSQVHSNTSLDRFVFSGNGAGKTTMAVVEAVWAAKGYNPILDEHTKVPARVIVVLDSPSKVTDVWIPEIKKWFDTSKWKFSKEGSHDYRRIQIENGSEIKFMFHLQEPMAFESLEAQGMVVYDEPPPRHIFVALKRGSRTKGHTTRHLMIGTPLAAPWLREQIYEPWSRGELKDTHCFRFSTVVNEANLKEGYLEEFTRHLSDKEKEIRLHGQFFDLEGLALAHLFRRELHVIPAFKWPDNWPTVIAIDPAMSKPHVACLLGASPDGKLYYIDEYSAKEEPEAFAKEIKRRWYTKFAVLDVVCDSMGSGGHTGGDGLRSFIDVCNGVGLRARATSYQDKNDEAWIAAIQEILAIEEGEAPDLQIFDHNAGIIADIENVQWLKLRNQDHYKPKLDISKKDFLACLKYALATRLRFNKKRGRIMKTHGGRSAAWKDRDLY